ncbi:hypothetical protein JJB07_13895 [Tumebacillus sp. ITR2]|uniref:Uncharacterized protein n=1 Tax=Tumebacillus amylolyticus TaxID=2801339 RepID=A0ABS1JBS3_9BACL|nr:hypothetical protein [Tumebacillus amylolyticus]MBL0387729.1 hypothetical protein [Tumebacillus amylolyticus]
MRVEPESLYERFLRLRTVVSAWEIRYNQLPAQVLSLFDQADLDSIAGLMVEKRRLEMLIPELQDFIRKWEDDADFERDRLF